ncbi:14733_t:CDS:1, partial [Cetraspora pellucida]
IIPDNAHFYESNHIRFPGYFRKIPITFGNNLNPGNILLRIYFTLLKLEAEYC